MPRPARLPRDSATKGSVDVGVPYGGTPTIYRNVAIIGAATGEIPQGPPAIRARSTWSPGRSSGSSRPFPSRARSSTTPGATDGRIARARTCGGSPRRSISSAASSICRLRARRPTTTVAIVRATTSSPTPSSRSMRRPGKYRWHFQTVHHDIWDIDMPSAGALIDFVQDGRRTPAIAHVGKSELCVRARSRHRQAAHSGRGAAGAEGRRADEWYSPTQPFPVRPGPLSRDELQQGHRSRPAGRHDARARRGVHGDDGEGGGFYNAGPFTPFLFKEIGAPPKSTIQFPGGTGGVNWGGMAADPTTGIVLRQCAEHVAGRLGRAEVARRDLQLRSAELEPSVRPRQRERRRIRSSRSRRRSAASPTRDARKGTVRR